MALIICPECGNQVSDKAEICPHCGIKIAGNISPTPPHNVTPAQVYDKPAGTRPAGQAVNAEQQKKKSYTLLIVSFVIALVICGCVYYFYSATQQSKEQEDYEFAIKSNDIEVMQMYLARYGEAPQEHRDSVNAHLQMLTQQDNDWTNAVVSGSKGELERYIKEHPDSPHKGQALNMIDSIDFAIADRTKTVESYKLYLQQHPDGKYANKAQDFIDEKSQSEVQPEELAMARNTCRKFFQAINSRNADKLVENVAEYLDNFLNRSGASSNDVVSFMNKLYKDDITNMNWHILDDFKAEKVVATEGYNVKVQFSAEQKIERTDSSKEKYGKYNITAEINPEGKICSFTMKKVTVTEQ